MSEEDGFDGLEDDGTLMNIQITPKGFLYMLLINKFQANNEQCQEIWEDWEAFCYQELGRDTAAKDFEFAAVVFDGVGGAVIGLDQINPEDFDEDGNLIDEDEDYDED